MPEGAPVRAADEEKVGVTTATVRDGTSQSGRLLAELDPDYARVDERTTRDLLAFAKSFADELAYFGLDDPDRARGSWAAFMDDVDLDVAARYATEPESLPVEAAGPYARPHFALFLAFLELLGDARRNINGLTRRHLEFYYRDVLRMVRKGAVPDTVHVLVDLDGHTDRLRLPAGTALNAGKDAAGKDLLYRTRRDIVAGHVEVGQVNALFAETRVTSIPQACPPDLKGGNRTDSVVAMFEVALGQPQPGDPLPLPIYPGQSETAGAVTFADLVQAHDLVGIAEAQLGMPSFEDLRTLMHWKRLREADPADWKAINAILQGAGRRRADSFRVAPESTAFAENLEGALGKPLAPLFAGLLEVTTVDEAYAALVDRPDDVRDFLTDALAPIRLDEFADVMRIKTRMDNQWAEIDRLLEAAGQYKRRDPAFVLSPETRASRDLPQKLGAAVNAGVEDAPPFELDGGLDAYFDTLQAVERYFFMSAEDFKYVMSVARDERNTDRASWNGVYETLLQAHREMVYARRRDALARVAQDAIDNGDNARALGDMLMVVVGEALSAEEALDKLDRLDAFGGASDRAYLDGIIAGREPTPDWADVAKVLEIAQRNREGFEPPVAEKVEWRNLYPLADADQATERPSEDALPRWRTFGHGGEARAPEPVPPADFGFAIASPLLALAEGARSITLTLGLDPEGFDLPRIRHLLDPQGDGTTVAAFNPFQVLLSTAKGWLEPEAVELSWVDDGMGSYPPVEGVDVSELHALVLKVTLPEGYPALTSPTSDVHGAAAQAPALRMMLRPVWNEVDRCYLTSSYQILRGLVLRRARLAVEARGLAGLTMRNDESVLDAKKPFEPFGFSPAAGSRFYCGHPEIVSKTLERLSFRITWMGAPADLGAHYANYPGRLGGSSFSAKVGLVEGGVVRDFPAPLDLFDEQGGDRPVTRTLTPPSDQGAPAAEPVLATDVTDWNRYLLWELNTPDFQHSRYPTVALQQSLRLSADMSAGSLRQMADPKDKKKTIADTGAYQVNPPYTPKIKSLTLDYSAAAEVVLDPAEDDAAAITLFHVHPFGRREVRVAGKPGLPLLPQYTFEGELYVGLRHVEAPQNVSLLFQVAEGSADPDLAPEPVEWSYLSGDRWCSLQDGSLLADGTRGLINSGIVELSLQPAEPGTLLPPDLYWIRIAIPRASGSVCDMIAIHPNAVPATFEDRDNDPGHLSAPLPHDSISAPLTRVPGVSGIRQPYTSFGGRAAEPDESFYVRVSERLRHKRRARSPWDYERLVLEEFPQIYKAKCLRADSVDRPHAARRVEVVVIPDIRNRRPFEPEPKAPADLIRDIETFLRGKASAFADVEVKNAHYLVVKVRCAVRFVEGQDEGFCRRQLNQELNRFLSPWAYEEGADLVIGGSIYANSIVNFIDGRDYVDYVAGLRLFSSDDGGRSFELVPETVGYHAGPRGRADAVLVAARRHVFDRISDADYRVEEFTGINFTKIELDFVVS